MTLFQYSEADRFRCITAVGAPGQHGSEAVCSAIAEIWRAVHRVNYRDTIRNAAWETVWGAEWELA